jgi:hypothetical protein
VETIISVLLLVKVSQISPVMTMDNEKSEKIAATVLMT